MQIELVRLGRLVEREFPNFAFVTLEELRVHLNTTLHLNIQRGDHIPAVYENVERAIFKRAFDRAKGQYDD